MSRLHLTWAAAVLVASGAAFAQDTSGGPGKSIAPKSLSGTTSGSSDSSGDASTPNQGATTPSPGDPGRSGGADTRTGGTPQGRNNTMDDAGAMSSGPGEGPRR